MRWPLAGIGTTDTKRVTEAMDRTLDFEDFYRAHRDRLVRSLALGLGDSALAAEAVDEAMARAFQRWGKVSAYDNPAGWVYRVARNWATSSLRRLRFRSSSPVPEMAMEDSPVDDTVRSELARLSEPTRQVIVLRYLLGWSQQEIAEVLDLNLGTVKSRINRGLEQLRMNKEALR